METSADLAPDAVTQAPLVEGQRLPLIMRPARPSVRLASWGAANRALVEAKLYEHGCILFRDFELAGVPDFEAAALALCPTLFGEYGDLPREGVSKKVYGSTPYPADKSILFHNESSHLPRWPMKQFFFCVKASQSGGQTPILDCRAIVPLLDPKVLAKLADKGLMYVRNFSDGIDVPWQKFFHTDDPAVVEEACKSDGMTCEWTEDGGLRIRQVSRAVAKHPKTGDTVFFNQLQLHHVSCLDEKVRTSLRMLFEEEDLPRNVYYGDGSPLEDEVVAAIGALYDREAKLFDWHDGDMVMLDNMLVSHARLPYVGPRKIVVAMGEMMESKDLPAA